MRNALLLLALLSTGLYIPAQQTSSTGSPTSEGCPIGLSAQVNGRAIARSVEDQKKNGDGPLLELTFERRNAPKMLSASVTVHGLASSNRYLPVNKGIDENRIQSFDLGPSQGASELTNTEVRVTKMLFVRWIEVNELRYADGSTWHASSGEQCSAVPSKLRLVDASAAKPVQRLTTHP